MGNEEFLRICKEKVAEYINQHMDKTDQKQITANDVYVVWMCYELTYNGDKAELYFDAYKKFQNICFKM